MGLTFTLQSLSDEAVQQTATVITECKSLVVMSTEPVWYIYVKPLLLLQKIKNKECYNPGFTQHS